ncbi:MAG: PQQ-binding-like beta-propeller repeat protein, partial [Planctomycetota bacterium]
MTNQSLKLLAVALVFVLPITSTVLAEDWNGFLGDGSSYRGNANTPVEFDATTGKNIAWNVPLMGRGISGALVVGDRVFVSSCDGEHERDLYLQAFDLNDGSELWTRFMRATGRPFTHPTGSNAGPTPVSDGKHVIALFSSNDLMCYDLQGNLQWYRAVALDYPKMGNDISMSSSPVIADGAVVVQLENQGNSIAAGFDVTTGEELWSMKRREQSNYSSPSVVKTGDQDVVVLGNSEGVKLVHPRSGKVIQQLDASADTVSSIAYSAPLMIIPGESTTVFRLGAGGEKAELLWDSQRLRPQRASPVISDDRVYM